MTGLRDTLVSHLLDAFFVEEINDHSLTMKAMALTPLFGDETNDMAQSANDPDKAKVEKRILMLQQQCRYQPYVVHVLQACLALLKDGYIPTNLQSRTLETLKSFGPAR